MSISEDIAARAKRHDRRAMEAALAEAYPMVFRLAHALTGRPGAARQVVHDVLRRSLRVMPRWRKGAIPENWFYHHTVMTARAVIPSPPQPQDDVLVRNAPAPVAQDPAYVAFIRALRRLPPQQAEAFILNHCEKLNTRMLGVAMDCSQEAAAKHLQAAVEAIQTVGAENTAALTAAMERAYTTLSPPEGVVHPAARKYVTRHLRPRRVKQVILILLLVALGALAVGAWRWRERLTGQFEQWWSLSFVLCHSQGHTKVKPATKDQGQRTNDLCTTSPW